MAARLLALLICDAMASDPAGKITLYGLFDRAHFKHLPARLPLFAIYWRLQADTLGEASVVISRPDGTELVAKSVKTDQPGVAQGVFMLGGLEFAVAGEYAVRLLFDGKLVGETSLPVVVRGSLS